ncbi:hypothetical protein [Chryseobacterium gambrini]|uniref:hypothetical protein n=1 Tax=Chryseobacterium gambrini TaxID=373672 RepID=UPI0022F3B8F5|nr:hypothetical protein [Chryseobacterium gambrini]WBX99234.1 hypothetical protein PE065_08235 [Chryseobacterium gambrini]
MKVILSITLLISNLFLAQEYFLLDDLKTDFKINEYTLDTKDLYNIQKDINVFNIFISKENILLLSVLPDLDEKILPRMDERGNNWMIINYDKIKDKVFSKEKILSMLSDWKMNNTPEKKTFQYKLIKKENGSYYVSKKCLTEFFSIANLEAPLVSTYGTINTSEKKVTIQQMEKSFKKQIPSQKFIMDPRDADLSKNIDIPYSFRNYLSKELLIKRKKAYQFWTFDGWWMQDGYDEHRGIDRFLYIPDKGIVGGSFDFYFKLKPKNSSNEYYTATNGLLWNNIINEKIMIAKELK